MVMVHINNTKHITIANIYIPPRDTTSTHYKTADTDIQHCIQYITNIPHSGLTGDVNAHSTLWHSYTEDHRGQLIADVISNSNHITLNTNTPTRVPNTTLQQTSSPDITTVSNTLTIQTENTTSITSPTQTHNILQHSKAKKTRILTTAATQQTFPQTPTQSLQQTQEAITKYCAHLHHTLAALKRYSPPHSVAPLPSSEQTNLSSSNHTYTKSTPKHIYHHYAPSVTSTHTTHIISSTAPTYAPHCRPWICGQTPPE